MPRSLLPGTEMEKSSGKQRLGDFRRTTPFLLPTEGAGGGSTRLFPSAASEREEFDDAGSTAPKAAEQPDLAVWAAWAHRWMHRSLMRRPGWRSKARLDTARAGPCPTCSLHTLMKCGCGASGRQARDARYLGTTRGHGRWTCVARAIAVEGAGVKPRRASRLLRSTTCPESTKPRW